MHNGAQANFLSFAADGVELVLRKRGLAAFANAAGSKNLDDIGTIFNVLLDNGAQFVGRARGVAAAEDGIEGSEDTGARQPEVAQTRCQIPTRTPTPVESRKLTLARFTTRP